MSRKIAASVVKTCLAPSNGTSRSAARCIYPTTSRRNDLKISPSPGSSRKYTSSSTHVEARFEHPALNQLKDDLTVLQPCFGVRGDEIDVLFEPADFHRRLLVSPSKFGPRGTRTLMRGQMSLVYDKKGQAADIDLGAVYRDGAGRTGR